MSNEIQSVDAFPSQAAVPVSADLAMIKMEGETIMAAAMRRERDYPAVLQRVISQLSTFRTFAEEAVYARPVGGGKFARGLSIRAAEAIAEACGFNKIRVITEIVDADHARIGVIYTDYQSGRIWQDSKIVSKLFKRKDGTMSRHPEDRFWDVVCGAAKSKLIRECILRCVPPGLKSELMASVDEQLAKFLDSTTIGNLVTAFDAKGVSVDMLESFTGKKVDAFDTNDRVELMAVFNGLQQGEATVSEVFEVDEPAEAPRGVEGIKAKLAAKKESAKNGGDDGTAGSEEEKGADAGS